MIRILFPPGCYGHYVASCLYSYTELNTTDFKLEIDQFGSSHNMWTNADSKTKIINQHIFGGGDEYDGPTDTVTIIPERDHYLDYIDHQFRKWYKYDSAKFYQDRWWDKFLNEKLASNWNWTSADDPPNWIVREHHSLLFLDFLEKNYVRESYVASECVVSISTQDLFEDFTNTLNKLCNQLNLQLISDHKRIQDQHEIFIKNQIYHNQQLRIDQWITDLLGSTVTLTNNPCGTVLDEIYVQAKLRNLGYEIRCDGLDQFPQDTLTMKELVYKV